MSNIESRKTESGDKFIAELGFAAKYGHFEKKAMMFAPEVAFQEAQDLAKMRDPIQDQIMGKIQLFLESLN